METDYNGDTFSHNSRSQLAKDAMPAQTASMTYSDLDHTSETSESLEGTYGYDATELTSDVTAGAQTIYFTRTPDWALVDERIVSGSNQGTYYYLTDAVSSRGHPGGQTLSGLVIEP